jgi:hypothetical protein
MFTSAWGLQGDPMKVKTNTKAGKLAGNHNETLARRANKPLKLKTKVKAGRVTRNHNETLLRG